MNLKGMGSHQTSANTHDEWLTPPDVVKALGPFDLDPCSPIDRPWPTAEQHYTINDDGLSQPWAGFVWCNPPYGKETGYWLRMMASHNHGIALIFARTETKHFHEYVWGKCSGLLFPMGRLRFYHVDGTPGRNTGGAPSVFVAYGKEAAQRLSDRAAVLKGFYIDQPTLNL